MKFYLVDVLQLRRPYGYVHRGGCLALGVEAGALSAALHQWASTAIQNLMGSAGTTRMRQCTSTVHPRKPPFTQFYFPTQLCISSALLCQTESSSKPLINSPLFSERNLC
jgi:hypothetical protein